MDNKAIYHKTQKGQEEMASRAYKLPARERSVLILVDGKASAGEIIDKAKHFGDAEHFFAALIENGFIEPASGTAPQPVPPVPPATLAQGAPAATALIARSLPAAQEFAAEFLMQAIGPTADLMTSRIEACRDSAQLLELVEKFRVVVEDIAGSRKADEFINGTMARLPGP